MTRTFTAIVAAILLAFFITSESVSAMSSGEDAFVTFETLCLSDVVAGIDPEKSLETLGAKQLSDSENAELFGPQTGKGYLLAAETGTHLVFFVEHGACSLFNKQANPGEITSLFVSTIKNRLLDSQDEGSDTLRLYAVTYTGASQTIHGIVAITFNPTKNGARLSFVPEVFMRASGLTIPPWP